jgi:hypothetical protein
MAVSNHDRVGKALELLKSGLGPFVENTGCSFRDGFHDGILAILREGQGAAKGLVISPL